MKAWTVFAVLAVASAGQEWKTTVPFTYNIEYGPDHVNHPEYIKMIADAPPDLLHVGEDIPFSSSFGTKSDYAGVKASLSKLLIPGEVRARIAELKKYTDDLHQAGVRWVIPYIGNEIAFGDHIQRTGIFEFFDHWNDYREFGYPARPTEDLVLAQKFYPFRGIRRSKPEDAFYPLKLYTMCTNNPHWRAHLLAATANAARCGYDGIFVDVMTLRDYCPHCQRGFREYLGRKYSPAQRQRRFGNSGLESISLGFGGDGALWFDTQAFWSDSNRELLRLVRDEGRKTKPGFFAVPNLGPYAHFDGLNKRAWAGMSPLAWAQSSDLFLVEEMQRPGHLLKNHFIHNILQYKLAFAVGFRAGMLLYNAQERTGVELAMAEAAAGGGGALIQGHYRVPECRRRFRSFFNQHQSLWDGYQSVADVAVILDYEQLYWGNKSHLQAVYRLTDYLSEQHILFDFVTPANATAGSLSRYKAVITPFVRYMPDAVLAALASYQGRGVWIDIGDSGRFDNDGHIRSGVPAGARRYISLDELIEYPRFALYMLDEDDANSIEEITVRLKATLEGENPTPPSRIKQDLRRVLEDATHRSLAVLAGVNHPGLRVSAYQRTTGGATRLAAHFVNYDCPIPPKGKFTGKGGYESGQPDVELAPRPSASVEVELPVPAGKVVSARMIDPDLSETQALRTTQQGSTVRFTLPPVRVYKIVELSVE